MAPRKTNPSRESIVGEWRHTAQVGTALDTAIGESLFNHNFRTAVPPYSTNLAELQKVMDYVHERGLMLEFVSRPDRVTSPRYFARICRLDGKSEWKAVGQQTGDSIGEAVCHAVLEMLHRDELGYNSED